MNDEPSQSPPDECSGLLTCLEDEQRALEQLLFKLKEQNLILTAGDQRWLAASTSEVAAAVVKLTDAGRRRETAARIAHSAHRLPVGSTLGELADCVDDELTGQLMRQRQVALRDVLDQVRRCSRHNRRLLASGLAATNDALALLGATSSYDSSGEMLRSGLGDIRSCDIKA